MMKNWSREYLHIINRDYKGLNLTRILEPEEFYLKQVLDSLKPFEEKSKINELFHRSKLIVDVGFGGGFPILPLAKMYPDKKFVGIEARSKKAKAVEDIAEKLGMNNVRTVHGRLEEIFFDQPCFMTLKAVGKVSDFLPLVQTNQLLQVMFYKGPNFFEKEVIDNKMKWKLNEKLNYDLEKSDGRLALLFTNGKVPCGTLGKNMSKISVLLKGQGL